MYIHVVGYACCCLPLLKDVGIDIFIKYIFFNAKTIVTHVIVTWMKQDASFFPRVIFQFEMTASDNYFRQATRLAWY